MYDRRYTGVWFCVWSAIRGGAAGNGQHLKTVAASGGSFKGWSLNGDEENLYQPGDDITVTKSLADGNNTLTFKAVWGNLLKYAVSIYGINQDGAGVVTFGPATGADYTNSYKACGGTKEAAPNCIHWKTWTEIIEQIKEDPTVFQKCLENGCTHSVELSLSDKLKNAHYEISVMTGDGAAVLYDSISGGYRMWNSEAGGDISNGGWPGSRIRATLNGADQYTADGSGVDTGGGNIYYGSEDRKSNAGTDVLQASDALISAFPAELRDAIVPKAVISDTRCYDYSSTNYTFTTYDKLWLFSGAEIYQDAETNNNVIRPHEGVGGTKTPYDRAVKLGISTDSSLGNGYGDNTGRKENGAVDSWWLRSLYQEEYSYSIYNVRSDGDLGHNTANSYYRIGLSPGFCVGSK